MMTDLPTQSFLSEANRHELVRITRQQTVDALVWKRARTLLLIDQGYEYRVIATILDLSVSTLKDWLARFERNGLDGLDRKPYRKRDGHLNREQEQVLIRQLRDWPLTTTGKINVLIKRIFDVSFSKAGCIKLLQRLGFSYRKPARLPRQADEAQQQQFIDSYETLQNRIGPDEVVYFGDGVHPEYQTRPAYGWFHTDDRPVVETTSGRQRMNIQGALCLENFETCFLELDTIDANSVIQFFEKLQACNPTKSTIHLFLDNARYYKAQLVREWLAREDCRIKIHWVPAYCPHLNPIERLWGLMHKSVTHNKHYKSFDKFCLAVNEFLRETIPKQWHKMRDYITDNFRIISMQDRKIVA